MGFDDLRWKRNSTLKDMMETFNALVDEMQQMSQDLTNIAGKVTRQHAEISNEFHKLNDQILTVNYNTDEMKQDVSAKLDNILRSIQHYHPNN